METMMMETMIVETMIVETMVMMLTMKTTMIKMMDDDTGVVCACYPASDQLSPLPAL